MIRESQAEKETTRLARRELDEFKSTVDKSESSFDSHKVEQEMEKLANALRDDPQNRQPAFSDEEETEECNETDLRLSLKGGDSKCMLYTESICAEVRTEVFPSRSFTTTLKRVRGRRRTSQAGDFS